MQNFAKSPQKDATWDATRGAKRCRKAASIAMLRSLADVVWMLVWLIANGYSLPSNVSLRRRVYQWVRWLSGWVGEVIFDDFLRMFNGFWEFCDVFEDVLRVFFDNVFGDVWCLWGCFWSQCWKAFWGCLRFFCVFDGFWMLLRWFLRSQQQDDLHCSSHLLKCLMKQESLRMYLLLLLTFKKKLTLSPEMSVTDRTSATFGGKQGSGSPLAQRRPISPAQRAGSPPSSAGMPVKLYLLSWIYLFWESVVVESQFT